MLQILNKPCSIASQNIKIPKRSFFYWLTFVFNRVDDDRIKEVGPDRACAEWLLKNGASVRWKGSPKLLSDYNILISEAGRHCIEAVDATDSGITHIGFPYFEGCKYIEEVKLINCKYIDNRAMPLLSILKDTLTHFELVNCKGVDDEGIRDLKELKNLKTLKIVGSVYLKDKDSVHKELSKNLPNCEIDFK